MRGARARGRPARAAEAAGDGARGARLRRGPAAGRARLRRDRPARRSPPRIRPSATCSRAAAPGSTSASRSTSSTPAPPEPADWTLVGLRALAPDPRRAVRRASRPRAWTSARACGPRRPAPTLLKCCLLERGIERAGARHGRAVGRDPRGGPRGAARGWWRAHDRRVFGHLWGDRRDARRCSTTPGARGSGWRSSGRSPRRRASSGLIPEPAAREIAERAGRPVDLEAVGEETRAHRPLDARADPRAPARPRRRGGASGCTTARRSRTSPTRGPGSSRSGCSRSPSATSARSSASLAALADATATRVMLGRTHGQPGLPITFGFKAAVWVAEVRRHRERVAQARAAAGGRPARRRGRHAVGVGRPTGSELQRRVLERLGLGVPGHELDRPRATAWPSWSTLLALITGDAREDRQRGLQPPAPGDRRARRGADATASSAASRCRRSATRSAPSTW